MQDEEERRLEATEEPDGSIMEFRLTYDGELKSATKSKGRVEHKHDIRRVFHRQMRSVWATHPALGPVNTQRLWEREDFMRYHRDGFKWLPLVLKNQFMICELDVLILRRGRPGNFITQGDIDGKVKTLFDALQRPEPGVLSAEGIAPEEDEEPFYCLLEDDALIHKAAIETDSLHGPLMIGGKAIEESKNDARVVIKVTTKTIHKNPWQP